MAVSPLQLPPFHSIRISDKPHSLGDVFLKNAYFSHNVDQDQISLAKLV